MNDGSLLVGAVSDNDTLNLAYRLTLFKFNTSGNLVWNSMLTHPFCFPNCPIHWGVSQIEVLPDNSMLFTGKFTPFGAAHEIIYLLKTDSIGEPVWDYGITHCEFSRFTVNPDNSIYLGIDQNTSAYFNPRVDKLTDNGSLLFSNYYQPNIYIAGISDILPGTDGGFIACGGGTGLDPIFIVNADSTGSPGCYVTPDGTNLDGLPPVDVASPLFAYTPVQENVTDFLFPMTDSLVTVTQLVYCGVTSVYENAEGDIRIFPNPGDDEITISGLESPAAHMELYNLLSEVILVQQPMSDEFRLDVSHLDAGIYFLKIFTEKGEFVEKVVIK
jgi:hypothetical protein